jgi:hypothetical protein
MWIRCFWISLFVLASFLPSAVGLSTPPRRVHRRTFTASTRLAFSLFATQQLVHENDESFGDSLGTALFNFGPVSQRDSLFYTCERPGNGALRTNVKEQADLQQELCKWKSYLIDQKGVSHVVVLLDQNEIDEYAEPGLETFYRQHGVSVLWQPMNDPCAAGRILQFCETAAARDDESDDRSNSSSSKKAKIVAHCTGGEGRAGRVAAAWLVHRYGLLPHEATAETVQVARERGVSRKGDVVRLQEWLDA